MEVYQQLYHLLFNAATDAIRALEEADNLQAECILILAKSGQRQFILRMKKISEIATGALHPRNDIK